MRARNLITWFVVLLWAVATNHCAFEFFVPYAEASEHTFAAGEDGDGSCPSHQKDDPVSHTEGAPCIGGHATEASSFKMQVAFSFSFPSSVFSQLLSVGTSDRVGEVLFLEGRAHPPNLPLVSLSIASNAPPARTPFTL